MTSYFDVTFNNGNTGQGSVYYVWLFSCNDSMFLAVRKRFLRLNVIYWLRSDVQRICRRLRRHKEPPFQILLNLDKYNIVIKFFFKYSYFSYILFLIGWKFCRKSLSLSLSLSLSNYSKCGKFRNYSMLFSDLLTISNKIMAIAWENTQNIHINIYKIYIFRKPTLGY